MLICNRRSPAPGLSCTVIEEQLPLGALRLDSHALLIGTGLLPCALAHFDEGDGVPARAEIHANLRGLFAQRGKDGVRSHLPEPVAGIARVGLLPMHDGVPVTALGS